MVLREVRRQRLMLFKLSSKQLCELALVCRWIARRKMPEGLVCKKLPGDLGFGIFLHPEAAPLRPSHVIGSYSGKLSLSVQNQPDESAYAFALLFDVLLSKEEQKRFDPSHLYHPRRHYCLSIDAMASGNFMRLINHSHKPNLVAELCRIPKNRRGLVPSPIEVVYLVKKTIRPGEQLLVSYEGEAKSYWNTLKIKPLPITPKTFQFSDL